MSRTESPLPVALDAMGGDDAPEAIVEGGVRAHAAGRPVVLVGVADRIRPLLPRRNAPEVIDAPDVIGMDEAPSVARRRPDSSLRRALSLVASGRCSGAVSCGNSGALLVSAVLELGTLDGVERPAIASVLPRSDGGRLVLMDAGANVDCKPEHLANFALLGSIYASSLGVDEPRIGLLSNGEEDSKGNLQVRATLPLLRSLPLNVLGPVEPSAAMAGACDVLICDGFVGNVLLKAAEGAVQTVVTLLKEEITRRPTGQLGALLLRGAFRRFRERVAWDAHGGALLLGVGGAVVVGHGKATPDAVHAAVRMAHEASSSGLIGRLRSELDRPQTDASGGGRPAS